MISKSYHKHLLCCFLLLGIAPAAQAQSWMNPAVDQASLKSLPPLAPPQLPPPPAPPPKRAVLIAGSISDQDFPHAATNAGESGTVFVRMTINVRGEVENCATANTIAQPNLSAISCAIVKQRFRFTPAQDAKGKPAVDVKTQRITWLPPYQIVPLYPIVLVGPSQGMRIPLQVMVDAKGKVGQCRIVNNDHAAVAYQADICAALSASLTFPVKAGPYATDHVLWVAARLPEIEEQSDR